MLEGIVLHVGIAVQSTLRTAIRSRVAHAAADGRRGLRERQHGVAAAAAAQTDGRTDGRGRSAMWIGGIGKHIAPKDNAKPHECCSRRRATHLLTSQQISEFFLSWQHDVL